MRLSRSAGASGSQWRPAPSALRERHELLGARQPVVQPLRLAGPELLALGIGHEQRRADLRDLVAQAVGREGLEEAIARAAVQAVGAPRNASGAVVVGREQLGEVHVAVEAGPVAPPRAARASPPAAAPSTPPRRRRRRDRRPPRRSECSKASARGTQKPAWPIADDREPRGVHVGARLQRVDDGRQHRLPVGAERKPLLEPAPPAGPARRTSSSDSRARSPRRRRGPTSATSRRRCRC